MELVLILGILGGIIIIYQLFFQNHLSPGIPKTADLSRGPKPFPVKLPEVVLRSAKPPVQSGDACAREFSREHGYISSFKIKDNRSRENLEIAIKEKDVAQTIQVLTEQSANAACAIIFTFYSM